MKTNIRTGYVHLRTGDWFATVDGDCEPAFVVARSLTALAEKARRFDTDPEIAEALATANVASLEVPQVDWNDAAAVAALRAEEFDVEPLRGRGHGHERLDQLVNELLLGVR
jgi:hypothetical protein